MVKPVCGELNIAAVNFYRTLVDTPLQLSVHGVLGELLKTIEPISNNCTLCYIQNSLSVNHVTVNESLRDFQITIATCAIQPKYNTFAVVSI